MGSIFPESSQARDECAEDRRPPDIGHYRVEHMQSKLDRIGGKTLVTIAVIGLRPEHI
jgi:hypothetical protein